MIAQNQKTSNYNFSSSQPLNLLAYQQYSAVASLASYTVVNPTSTWTLANGVLESRNPTGAGAYADYIQYNSYVTNLSQSVQTYRFKAVTQNALSIGPAIGWNTINAVSNTSIRGICFLLTGALLGFVRLERNGITKAISAGSCNPVANDIIELQLSCDNLVYTLTATNYGASGLVQVGQSSCTYTFSSQLTTDTPNDAAKPIFYNNGGSQDVYSWTLTSNSYRNPKYAFIGDSITFAYSATTFSKGWPRMFMNYKSPNLKSTLLAKVGNRTDEIIAGINEVINVGADTYIFMLGGNDISGGATPAATLTKYLSILAKLPARSNVVNCLATPRNGTDMTAWNALLQATLNTVDTFTPLLGAGTGLNAAYSYDGTHLNDAGMAFVAQIIFLNQR